MGVLSLVEQLTLGLTFVVPAYNEENGIRPTLERLRAVLATLDLPSEILVVNDGSKDGTAKAAAQCDGVKVISHPINTGYGSAIKTGIICAQYPWVGIVDADGTYEIEMIPQLVEKMRCGFDMVVAARTNVLSLDKPLKRMFRQGLLGFLKLVINARIQDPNSGLRLFQRDMALTFFPFLCNTFSFTTSITIFAMGEGYFVTYVPMNYSVREGKSKVRHVRDSLRMMQMILQGITFFNPVKFSIILIGTVFLGGALPATIMGMLGYKMLAIGHLATVISAGIMLGLGIVSDIIRITAANTIRKKKTLLIDDHLAEISGELIEDEERA